MRDTKESRKDGISFYHIPAKGEKRRLWINAIKRKDYDPHLSATICSQHFVGGEILS